MKVGDKVICVKKLDISFYPWWESNQKVKVFKVDEIYKILSEPIPGNFFVCDVSGTGKWFIGDNIHHFTPYGRVEKLRRLLG